MSDPLATEPVLTLRLQTKSLIADDICAFELVHPEGLALPGFEPGAHITVETPNGAHRNYSLCNHPADACRYELAVKLDHNGRGGSKSMVGDMQEGDLVKVSPPVNDFPLVAADEYLFIAGGIGITPIISMMRHLRHQGLHNFKLIYCTRSRESTAFVDELSSPEFADHVTLHHDEGKPEQVLDLWPVFETPGTSQVYVCGPGVMMEDVRDMSGHWPQQSIHMEDFGSDIMAIKPEDTAFRVRHADSNEVLEIPAAATILETLRKHGIRAPSSCESGTCGTCKTELISGEADHRDLVLTESEKQDHIMICVSRAKSPELVLRW